MQERLGLCLIAVRAAAPHPIRRDDNINGGQRIGLRVTDLRSYGRCDDGTALALRCMAFVRPFGA